MGLQGADISLAFENELDGDDGLDPVMKEKLDRYKSGNHTKNEKC